MHSILKRIFNAVEKQSGIGFIVDALFGNFAYLHNSYTAVERHTNFVLKGSHCLPKSVKREALFQLI